MSDYKFTYLRPQAGLIQEYVDYCQKILEKAEISGDYSIAFTGNSGALIAPILSYILKKDLIVVRSAPSEHSFYMVEGPTTGKFILVDDFVDSGKTLETMLIKIAESRHVSLEEVKKDCLGAILYRDSEHASNWSTITSDNLKGSGITYLNFVLKEN